MFCGGMTRKDAVPNYSAMTSVIGETKNVQCVAILIKENARQFLA